MKHHLSVDEVLDAIKPDFITQSWLSGEDCMKMSQADNEKRVAAVRDMMKKADAIINAYIAKQRDLHK